tara:strand:+ start:758 stop:1024 length:267 start_codon:yes stop_codon:yes gene_type:complete
MFDEKELLEQQIEPDSVFKTFVVNYVGSKLLPEDGRITLEMIVEVLAKEFPELVLALAEENFIRGYSQGLQDSDALPPQKVEETESDA